MSYCTKNQSTQNLIDQFRIYLSQIEQHAGISAADLKGLLDLQEILRVLAARLDTLETQTGLLRHLIETSEIINSSLDIEIILTQVMDALIEITGAERCFLALANPTGETEIRIARNWEKESLSGTEVQFSHTIIEQVMHSCQPVLTTNAQMDPRFAEQKSVMMYQLRSILCVPFMAKGKCIGVIYADNRIRSGIFLESMLENLLPFANQAAIAIENAQLFQQIQQSLTEVRALKQTMDNVFSSIPSGVITTDPGLQITMQNKASEEILGLSELAHQRQDLADLLPVTTPLREAIERVMRFEERIAGIEIQIENPMRGTRDVRLSLSALKDEKQTIMGTAMVLEDFTDQRILEAKNALFERMVSPAVIAQLQGKSIEFGGEKKIITVLFADVRGFTSFSERHSPEELVSVLNLFLGAAANAILEEGGTIDKFLGDAVMAWFNAPVQQENHMLRAVRSALAIRTVVNRLNRTLAVEDRLSFGVGIHCGEAILGLIGAKKRMDYTAIGDCVNTAKRIQEHASAGEILVSQAIVDGLADQIQVEAMPVFQAKGKEAPLKVYALSALSAWGTP